jgi:putative exporter of polyketide antibiotics
VHILNVSFAVPQAGKVRFTKSFVEENKVWWGLFITFLVLFGISGIAFLVMGLPLLLSQSKEEEPHSA